MATQNVENVVNTKQLDNSFLLTMAMHLDSRRSNETHQIYESIGTILSIKDYSDNSFVELCFQVGCDYVINAIANIAASTRTLEIIVLYVGEIHFNQQVLIWGINMAFGE